jgi:hypothetical protein
VKPAELDRLGDGAGDAALDEGLCDRIGDHQVVFGDQDLRHASGMRTSGRLVWSKVNTDEKM